MNKEQKIKILFIDDEPNNLVSFKAAFRLNYDIFLANNTEEARVILGERPDIQIIFSDQKMPRKTGVEFFEEIRGIYPDAIRILITGFADIESVIAAINKGHVFRYIKKPWEESDIHSAIDEAHKFYLTSTLLKKKNKELEKAYRELDRFAYSATHDMRGPILSVRGITDLMKKTNDLSEIREMAGMIENAMMMLDGYIKNLHEHYSARRGELHFSDISIEALLHEMGALFDPVARLNEVSFSKSRDGFDTFRSDLTSLKVILNNLLTNAFKYQRKEEHKKRVDLHLNARADRLLITVSDNGIGIPQESREDIFNIFYRATHESYGSGFGLYNVKDILNKLEGSIEVESRENEGSIFKVSVSAR